MKYNVSKLITASVETTHPSERIHTVDGESASYTCINGCTLQALRDNGWTVELVVDLEADPPGTIRRYRDGDYLYIKAADGEWYRISHTVGTLSNPELTTVES